MTGATNEAGERWRFEVGGIVQGVGFRPFVHTLAHELGLSGFVINTAAGVVIEAEGPSARLNALRQALVDRPPALAVVESVEVTSIDVVGDEGILIVRARQAWAATLVSPDVATCAACRPRCSIRPTGGTGTRSRTAPTAVRGTRS